MSFSAHGIGKRSIWVCSAQFDALLSISAVNDYGNWRLTVELSAVDGTTTLVLRQEEVDPGSLPETGPGWEWYLDRLVAAIAEHAPPTIEETRAGVWP